MWEYDSDCTKANCKVLLIIIKVVSLCCFAQLSDGFAVTGSSCWTEDTIGSDLPSLSIMS